MVSIVIPAYNEETIIEETIRRFIMVFEEAGLKRPEVIVVDDGSSDKTGGMAEKAGAIVVRHPHNVGYGASIKTGISRAQNDTIVISDADGTYPIEIIPKLYEIYSTGFNMVVGAREGKIYEGTISKSYLRKILKMLVEFTAGRKIPDINSGLRIFSKKEINTYLPSLCDTFSFTTSLTLGYMMTGKFVAYHPIKYEKRVGKTKVKMLRDSLRTLQFIVEAILFYNPIKIFISFSIGLMTAAIIGTSLTIFTHINGFYYLSLACVVLSVLMFGFGLNAVLLRHILNKIK